MKIISVPHQTLRTRAQEIKTLDKKVLTFIKDLSETLLQTNNPPGVGLAAPQVDTSYRIFATYLSDGPEDSKKPRMMRTFINPVVIDHSENMVFGHDSDEPRLEGCLSIPGLYGAVPRFQWIEFEFLYPENGELKPGKERFTEFTARVMQHEFDHLDGILYTDYSLEYDLPVYQENPKTKKLEEIDKTILQAF